MPLGQNKHDMDISIRQIGDEPMEEKEIKEPTGMTVSMVSNMIFLIEQIFNIISEFRTSALVFTTS